jgi:hypothetical protein
MKILEVLAGVFFSIALSACAPVGAPGPGANEQVRITLSRGVCFGFCPDYTVTITGAGDVAYVGRRFVNVSGEQRATIPASDVARLIARFDAARFDSLRDEYRAQVTDLPTYTLTLERNGRRKTVVDYGGTGAGMPEAVRELQDEVDRVAGTARWVLRNGEPVRTPDGR